MTIHRDIGWIVFLEVLCFAASHCYEWLNGIKADIEASRAALEDIREYLRRADE